MKECPSCHTTYTDETLMFCLADGASLTDVSDHATIVQGSSGGSSGEKTVAMGGGQMRVDIPDDITTSRSHTAPPRPAGSSGLLKVLLVFLGLGILVVIVALIGTIAYYNMRTDRAVGPANDVKMPAASPAPAKDDKDELRDQIANLQKQLAEQKNTNRPGTTAVPAPNLSSATMTTTARANSPADGFLALRSLPSTSAGDRILKIPHGAVLSVGACGPVEHSVHPGRWCEARYNGYSGYVYDYYLIY